MTDNKSYETWKAEAIEYAWKTYNLPDDCIEDDRFHKVWEQTDMTPQEAIDAHCERFDIDKTTGLWGIGS